VSTATVTLRSRSGSTSSGLTNAVRSEWTKLRTVRSSWLNIVSAAALTTLLGTQYGFSLAYDNTHLGPGQSAEQMAIGEFGISAVTIVQVVVAAFALLTVTWGVGNGSVSRRHIRRVCLARSLTFDRGSMADRGSIDRA
jgi:ABC-2 type transport system permease protein